MPGPQQRPRCAGSPPCLRRFAGICAPGLDTDDRKITNTQTANSADIMKFSDRFTQNLQTARKDNAALDEALKPIDEYNKRFGNRGNNTPRNTDGGTNP